MSTPGNGSVGVRLVCTLGVCTGGGGGGAMLVVLFHLGVVGAMGLEFLMVCDSRGVQGPAWTTTQKHHGRH